MTCDLNVHVSFICTHLHHFERIAFSASNRNDRLSLIMALPENVRRIGKQSFGYIIYYCIDINSLMYAREC